MEAHVFIKHSYELFTISMDLVKFQYNISVSEVARYFLIGNKIGWQVILPIKHFVNYAKFQADSLLLVMYESRC